MSKLERYYTLPENNIGLDSINPDDIAHLPDDVKKLIYTLQERNKHLNICVDELLELHNNVVAKLKNQNDHE